MGKTEKPSFRDKIKAGLETAKTEAAKVTKVGLEAAKVGVDIVAEKAEVAAKASAKAIKDGAEIVAEKTGEAKAFADEKLRASIDKAYKPKQAQAQADLKKLRAANPKASPEEILLVLEKNLAAAERDKGSDSEEFSSAAAKYVFTAIEVYGNSYKDAVRRQRLIDSTVLMDSDAAKFVAAAAGIGINFLLARLGGKGAAKATGKALAKVAGARAFIALLGIENPGKKSAAWLATKAVKQFMGAAPETWPETSVSKKK